jgi:hypothetical protein
MYVDFYIVFGLFEECIEGCCLDDWVRGEAGVWWDCVGFVYFIMLI